jgi:hypothetical protein
MSGMKLLSSLTRLSYPGSSVDLGHFEDKTPDTLPNSHNHTLRNLVGAIACYEDNFEIFPSGVYQSDKNNAVS